MDIGHVEASMCFPTLPRFCGQTFAEGKDTDVGLACVQAYNDWMVEEWCGDSGGRLIPLAIIPLWDVEAAAAEVRRNAGRGVRAVCFSELPFHLRLPTIHSGYWDPFLRRLRRDGNRGGHAHRLVVKDAGRVTRRTVGQRHLGLRQRHVVDDRLLDVRAPNSLRRPQASLRRKPDRLDPLRPPEG